MIKEKIEDDFKQAMKDRDETAVSSLRNLKAELANVEIARQKPLTDPEVIEVLNKKIKQHKDSIESFSAGGRMDLVEREQKQMEVLLRYQPKQLNETEIEKIAKEVMSELGAKADFGKVMGMTMVKVRGLADGGLVSKVVKRMLS